MYIPLWTLAATVRVESATGSHDAGNNRHIRLAMNFQDLFRPAGSPLIMGILNVTPDSFSDGGAYASVEEAVAVALQMCEDGATIIDVGGESTRPPGRDYGAGSVDVPLDEELARTIPVIEGICRERSDVTVSIDTMKPEVAERALRAGAAIINDVSGGEYDRRIWQVALEHDAPYVLMHGHDPEQRRPVEENSYDDVVTDVYAWLWRQVVAARAAGLTKLVVDPGIGFSKTAVDSIRLVRELWRFLPIELPVMVGLSRKSFIGRILGGREAEERLYGSIGGAVAAALNGASILRVHDVRATVEALKVFALVHDR